MRSLWIMLFAGALASVTNAAAALTLYAFDDLQLAVALSQASDGDTIKVGPGSYGHVLIRGDTYNQVNVGGNIIPGGAPALSSSVTVESLYPSNRAVIRSIDIRSSNYWNFQRFDIRPPVAGSYFNAVQLAGDNNSFQHSSISYGNSAGWTASDWNSNAGQGIRVAGDNNYIFNNYIESVSTGIVFDHSSVNGKAVHNTFNGLASDGAKALGNHTLLENNLFKNFKKVSGNHDDCVQSFSKENGVIGAGSVIGITIRGNMCISSEDMNDPLYSGTQGYAIFNGLAEDWTVENNILLSSTYHGINLGKAVNSVINRNTVLDDSLTINGANTVRVRINGNGAGNTISGNIANQIINNPNVTFADNVQINLQDYDDWFVDWMNYDFRLKSTAPLQDVGAVPTNAGVIDAVPVPASLLMLLSGVTILAGTAWRRRGR